MKKIKLTQGKYTLVDDADFDWLNQWKWHAIRYGQKYYAARSSKTVRGSRYKILMHRIILNIPKNMETDHINNNGLDNQLENLRMVTKSQNQMNSKSRKNDFIYKGISWHKASKKWEVQISLNKKSIYIGLFDNPRYAAMAYDINAKALFGEFARLNFN